MYDLKCKRKGCEFNKNSNCTAKVVEVTQNTGCKTYIPSEKNKEDEVSKVGQPAIRKDIEVDCKADCIFNNNNVCSANGITVQTLSDKSCPNCCTFMPK